METKAKFCDTCHACLVNNDGIAVRSALHLTKAMFEMYICETCCTAGKHLPFQDDGFVQSGYKIVPGERVTK